MPDIWIERKDLPDDLLWVDGSKVLTMFGIYLDGYPLTMEWRLEAVSHELCFSLEIPKIHFISILSMLFDIKSVILPNTNLTIIL